MTKKHLHDLAIGAFIVGWVFFAVALTLADAAYLPTGICWAACCIFMIMEDRYE